MNFKKITQLTGHNAAIFAIAEGQDDRHVLSGAGDGWVAQWNLDAAGTGQLLARVDTQIFSLCLLKNENLLVVGNMNGGVHWVDLANAENTKNIAHHRKGVFETRAYDKAVFTAGGDGKITRWSIEERRSLESLQLSGQPLRCLDFSVKRNEIAVGSSDNSIFFLDGKTLEIRQVLRNAHQNSVFSVRYSPDASYLLSGGRDAHLNSWELDANFKKIYSQPAHWFTINSIVFHPEGHLFATGSRDKSIKIWDAENFKLKKVLEGARDGGHFHSVNRLFWSKHRDLLLSASDDRTIIIWETQ